MTVLTLFLSPILQESNVRAKELRAKIDAAEHQRLENIQLQANHVSKVRMWWCYTKYSSTLMIQLLLRLGL